MHRILQTRKSTQLGLIVGGILLLITAALSHTEWLALFNLPGLALVLGGTAAATVVSRPLADVVRTFRSIPALMHDDAVKIDRDIEQLLEVAHWHRAGRIGPAEQAAEKVVHPIVRDGAQLVLDREPLEHVVKTLQWRIAAIRNHAQGDAHILRTMATFAPAFGMLGTLFGLIQMLSNLGAAGLPQLGATMSFALVTTLYGLVLANLLFKPLAIKAEQRVHNKALAMNVLLEGIVLLHQRRHPSVIREALTTYMSQQQVGAASQSLARAA